MVFIVWILMPSLQPKFFLAQVGWMNPTTEALQRRVFWADTVYQYYIQFISLAFFFRAGDAQPVGRLVYFNAQHVLKGPHPAETDPLLRDLAAGVEPLCRPGQEEVLLYISEILHGLWESQRNSVEAGKVQESKNKWRIVQSWSRASFHGNSLRKIAEDVWTS